MRTYYKVTVEAEVYDDNGELVRAETLFAASNPRAEALLRFAPTEVDDALRFVAGISTQSEPLPAVPVPVADWDRATVPAPVDGAATVQQAEVTATPPKTRKRRTKAEIAADEAAALASQAGAEPGPASEAALAEAAGYMTPDGPVTTQPAAPVVAPEPVPAEVSAAPSGDGAPWNPFMQR